MRAPRTLRTVGITLGGLLLAGWSAAALSGCGIAPTDVIDAGVPATGVKAPGRPDADVQLFFYGPAGLRSATRPAKEPVDPQQAIDLLLAGPNHAERQRGLTSVLPKLSDRPTAETGAGKVDIALPLTPRKLDTASLSQLVCTAANARIPGDKPPGEVIVNLTGSGDRVGPMVCGGNTAFPVLQPTPAASPPTDSPE
ncbi:hypothetical protein ACIBK8_05770 [Streptomyces sp. NPDC050161]|uniref:hypothetical protein n=1 Tax=Streptomyces sp. NPDC050161 TaxID=3365604 RepID=UPI00378E3286